MAEVLTSFRKIVLRGLIKQSGKNWHLDGCPSHVYERLKDRKEIELAIERLSTGEQELMSFATFGDLADILEANDELAQLLHNLAPSREILCARLTDLESLRAKLSMARQMNSDELSVLTNYSLNLRQVLAGARKRRQERRGGITRPSIATTPMSEMPIPPPVEPVRVDPLPDVDVLWPDDVEQPPPPLGADVSTTVIEQLPVTPPQDAGQVEVTAVETPAGHDDIGTIEKAEPPGEDIEAAEEPISDVPSQIESEPATEIDDEELIVTEEAVAEILESPEGTIEDVIDDDIGDAEVLAAEAAAEPIPPSGLVIVDPQAMAVEISEALAAEDDQAVLRLLRREIIAVSESVYRLDEDIATAAWDAVREAGWFDDRRAEMGLGPIEEFYELIEHFESERAEHVGPERLRTFLSDHDFPKLLLTLRDVFLRNDV
jgi:hypothetical protein